MNFFECYITKYVVNYSMFKELTRLSFYAINNKNELMNNLILDKDIRGSMGGFL